MLAARNEESVATVGKVTNVCVGRTEVFYAREAQFSQLRSQLSRLKEGHPRLTAGCCTRRGHCKKPLVIAGQQILWQDQRERDLSSRGQHGHLFERAEDRLSSEVLGDAEPGEERWFLHWISPFPESAQQRLLLEIDWQES